MKWELREAANLWLKLERPEASVILDLWLPCGLRVDVAAVEDGRICGILFWTGADEPNELARLALAAKGYLAEIWVLSTRDGLGMMKGALPLHVGCRVMRHMGSNPAITMPASVNTPGPLALLEIFERAELEGLAEVLDVPATPKAIVAAGHLAVGKPKFLDMLTDVLRKRATLPPPSQAEILAASRPWSAVVPPVYAEA